MAVVWHFEQPRIPVRGLILSFGALLVPLAATLFAPSALEDQAVLLWLLALVPAFLLAYYRGWRGAATALAIGMAVLSLAEVTRLASGRSIQSPALLLGVVAFYVCVTLGLGLLSEKLHLARAEAERMALTDDLTALPNRRRARLYLERVLDASAHTEPFTVVLFDIDGFKTYNDEHGHMAGDAALCMVAGVLRASTDGRSLSARYGGEEFLSVLPGQEPRAVLPFVDRVREALRRQQGLRQEITVSAGLARFQRGMSYAELLEAADRALYEAKRAGRNRVHVFEPIVA
ncbi:MAG: GGDEF domain-containing protein [Longimicrobiales bacterium]